VIIIALSGKKRSGKNTIAKHISLLTSVSTKEFAFADALKEEVAKICGVSVQEIETNKDLYRSLLQAWGCYARATKSENYWIAKVLMKIRHCNAEVVFVTDVRFPNEAQWMRDCGATLVRVSRNTGLVDTHESETALDNYKDFDSVILNTGTIDHLIHDVREFMQKQNIPLKKD